MIVFQQRGAEIVEPFKAKGDAVTLVSVPLADVLSKIQGRWKLVFGSNGPPFMLYIPVRVSGGTAAAQLHGHCSSTFCSSSPLRTKGYNCRAPGE